MKGKSSVAEISQWMSLITGEVIQYIKNKNNRKHIISNCNVFVYVTLAYVFQISIITVKLQRLLPPQGQSQTYPEEERPCLSKYWKIYFRPDREISLALFLDYLFFQFFAD